MFYRFLQSNPAIRLVVPLVLGILIGSFCNVLAFSLLFVALGIWVVLVVMPHVRWRVAIGNGFLIMLFFIVWGAYLVQQRKERFSLPKGLQKHYVKAVLLGQAEEKERSTAIPIMVVQLKEGKKLRQTHFKSLAYFPKDSTLQKWSYGDTIVTELHFYPLRNNTNPYAFNYAKLLERRQIYSTARGTIAKTIWIPTERFSLFGYARETQKRLTLLLDSYIPHKKASGFLQAMSLGDKTHLASEVQLDFAAAGVVHILAVSGLHVGILFLLINVFFRPLRATRLGRVLLVCIGLFAIWSFAFISGLSVSILRAAIMFSVLQLSALSLRPYRIYNAIAISAFVLLLINPFYLYEVGFQLSYLAVLSIVTFVPLWDKWTVKNVWVDKLKKLLLVSLSAQLGVAPLVLYYFHHLPTYFLLGNVVVLVLAPFLLGGSLLVLLSSGISFLAEGLGSVVSRLTEVCLWCVSAVAKLPRATLVDYSLDFYQMLLLYLLLLAVVFYAVKRKGRYFTIFLGFVWLFFTYTHVRSYREAHQELFVVHDLVKKSCYSFVFGREAIVWACDSLDDQAIEYCLHPFWEAKGVKESAYYFGKKLQAISASGLYKNGHIQIKGRHIVFCPQELGLLDEAISVDVLVIANTSDWRVGIKNYQAKQVVIDSSFSKWESQKVAEELARLDVPIHNVTTKGAFVLDEKKRILKRTRFKWAV